MTQSNGCHESRLSACHVVFLAKHQLICFELNAWEENSPTGPQSCHVIISYNDHHRRWHTSNRSPSLKPWNCSHHRHTRDEVWTPLYLLSLLKFQFDGRFDAVAGVVIGLFKRQLHEVLVVRPCHVAAQKNDNIGQNLFKSRGEKKKNNKY